jgi:hypothetical protein
METIRLRQTVESLLMIWLKHLYILQEMGPNSHTAFEDTERRNCIGTSSIFHTVFNFTAKTISPLALDDQTEFRIL